MIAYRIYTEDLPIVREYAISQFEGCTIISTLGVWKGTSEKAIIIEVLKEEPSDDAILFACKVIKGIGKQEAVLYTKHEVKGDFV